MEEKMLGGQCSDVELISETFRRYHILYYIYLSYHIRYYIVNQKPCPQEQWIKERSSQFELLDQT